MRGNANAPSRGSIQRQATGLGRIRRGALATRAASERADGSGAPSPGRRLAALVGLAVFALLAAPTSGAAVPTPERFHNFGPDGTEGSDFQRIAGVAVDQQTGAVYVLDAEAGALYKFAEDGTPLDWGGTATYISENEISGLAPFTGDNQAQVAVDSSSHVVYVTEQNSVRAFQADGEPAEFTAGPGDETSEVPGFGELFGVAVDSEGAIYATDGEAGTVSVFSSAGELLTSFAVSPVHPEHKAGPKNLAVGPDGTVYMVDDRVASENGGIDRFAPSGFPVTAATTYAEEPTIQPPSGSFFYGVGVDPLSGDVFVLETNFGNSWISKYNSAGAFQEYFGRPGEEGESKGIAQGVAVVGGGEEFQFYLGTNEGEGDSKVAVWGVEIVEGPPAIDSTSVIDVSADAATLRAVINPNTAQTTYRFEYGPHDCAVSACTSVPLGGATIAAGYEPVAIAQQIVGLRDNTTYYYRVVAKNHLGPTVEGPVRTFTTQISGLGFHLADNRAWEMVSPPRKFGGLIQPPFPNDGGHLQAAADGNGLLYNTLGSIEAHPEGNRAIEDSSALARRKADGSWSSKDLTLPHTTVTSFPEGAGREYKLLSPNLERALLEPRDATPHSPAASERTPYLRENTEPSTYTPLLTGKEGFANVPPGTEFGGDPLSFFGGVSVVGASPDLGHVVLQSNVPLATGAADRSLYKWTEGQLRPVSVLPASEGGATVEALLGSGAASVRKAISDVGSRVFWSTATGPIPIGLYLRDMGRQETVRLDVVGPGLPGLGAANPVFQGADAEGTVALFTDSRQLTPDANQAGRDLYRCEVTVEGGELGCELTNLTAGTVDSNESADVLGLASGMSDDATRVYFVARGVLDPTPNGHGDSAASGEPNLYLWQEGSGVHFITTLAGGDGPNWAAGSQKARKLSAAASPSGRYLAFMSQRGLTGYDNRDARSGEPAQEVFRYDAVADELICASCNPSGASPVGLRGVNEGSTEVPAFDPQKLWNERAVAAVLPEATNLDTLPGASLYRPRAVHDNGRLFFNAADSLVPADSNGNWDVYQYEPTGTGDCSASSVGASIARSAGGCVSLISSGTSEEESAFLDASVGGDDVFFYTSAQLSVTDEDGEVDIYDARVNGIAAKRELIAECLGETCQPAARVPSDPTPASATFRGQGDVKPPARKRCGKGKRVIKRGGKSRCAARKSRRRKGKAKRTKRAAKHGRASR